MTTVVNQGFCSFYGLGSPSPHLTNVRKKGVFVLKANQGSAMVEYALIASLMAVAVIGIITQLGDELESVFHTITNAISDSVDQYNIQNW